MNTTPRGNPDFTTLIGVAVALASLLGGLVLEGGSIRDVAQLNAAIIVLGGTLGAVLVSTPASTLAGAARGIKHLFLDRPAVSSHVLDELIRLSGKARKLGLASLETDASESEDAFLKKALGLVVDSTPVPQIRGMMEIDLDLEESRLEGEYKVFEAAGGYAPTVGIIGAVLGLIQVMKHLENIDAVGRGIAVSFVATVYGVALANLILLPAAAKLRARAARHIEVRELILEGVLAIAEMTNTTLLKIKLEPFVPQSQPQRHHQAEQPAKPRRTASTAA